MAWCHEGVRCLPGPAGQLGGQLHICHSGLCLRYMVLPHNLGAEERVCGAPGRSLCCSLLLSDCAGAPAGSGVLSSSPVGLWDLSVL